MFDPKPKYRAIVYAPITTSMSDEDCQDLPLEEFEELDKPSVKIHAITVVINTRGDIPTYTAVAKNGSFTGPLSLSDASQLTQKYGPKDNTRNLAGVVFDSPNITHDTFTGKCYCVTPELEPVNDAGDLVYKTQLVHCTVKFDRGTHWLFIQPF